jgi:ATP-dependent RNA helicase DDX46/PRP5
LEVWKKKRALEQGKAKSSTPEPQQADVKPTFSSIKSSGKGALLFIPLVLRYTSLNKIIASLPAKPATASITLPALSRIGLPLKPGTASSSASGSGTHLKRTITALDDEEQEDRKLQKLDLPDVNPDVQSGDAANVDKIGDDLAVADVEEDEEDVKPEIIEEKMEVDKVEVEDDEVDPLDAFMMDNDKHVVAVNTEDARKAGLFGGGDDSDDEPDVENKQEVDLTTKEALLQ